MTDAPEIIDRLRRRLGELRGIAIAGKPRLTAMLHKAAQTVIDAATRRCDTAAQNDISRLLSALDPRREEAIDSQRVAADIVAFWAAKGVTQAPARIRAALGAFVTRPDVARTKSPQECWENEDFITLMMDDLSSAAISEAAVERSFGRQKHVLHALRCATRQSTANDILMLALCSPFAKSTAKPASPKKQWLTEDQWRALFVGLSAYEEGGDAGGGVVTRTQAALAAAGSIETGKRVRILRGRKWEEGTVGRMVSTGHFKVTLDLDDQVIDFEPHKSPLAWQFV